jgi:hypothetical protein
MTGANAAKPAPAPDGERASDIGQLGGALDFEADTTTTPNLQDPEPIVLGYAGKGWQVFPLKPCQKLPATRRGLHDATGNAATLRRYFTGAHPYNIGIRTGVPSGVFVLDVDGDRGLDSLAGLVERHGLLPPTLTSATSKGRHYWFRALDAIPCSASRIAPGIDIRGDGGYVVAPPSVHPDGAIYRWVNDQPAVDAPEWLIKLASHRPAIDLPPAPPVASSGDKYCRAALELELRSVAEAVPGTRNHALNRASYSLHQFVAAGKLDAGEVVDRLLHAAHACGLLQDDGERQVMATIRSGARAGLQNPRKI